MIDARIAEKPQRLVARLAGRARALAEAHAENVLRIRRRDPWRWRGAHLLWPLFTKGR